MSTDCNYAVKYAPLLRLLESRKDDYSFLESHEAYSADLGREYESLWRTAVLAYVRALEGDWGTLYEETRPYALQDEQLAQMLSSVGNRLNQVTRRIKTQLKLQRWAALPGRRVKGAAAVLDQMSEISRLSRSALAVE